MDEIETIRDALKYYAGQETYALRHETDDAKKALAALDKVEPRVLPELPKNVQIFSLWQAAENRWRCGLTEYVKDKGWTNIKESNYGTPTPREAVLAAIEKIGEK